MSLRPKVSCRGNKRRQGFFGRTHFSPVFCLGQVRVTGVKCGKLGDDSRKIALTRLSHFLSRMMNARCVLCQQHLESDTTRRLTRFEEFVTSAAERDVRAARDAYELPLGDLENLTVSNNGTEETLRDLRIEDEYLAEAVEKTLSLAEQRRTAIVEALANGTDLGELADLPSNSGSGDSCRPTYHCVPVLGSGEE